MKVQFILLFQLGVTSHQHCKGSMATFQLYWWRKMMGALFQEWAGTWVEPPMFPKIGWISSYYNKVYQYIYLYFTFFSNECTPDSFVICCLRSCSVWDILPLNSVIRDIFVAKWSISSSILRKSFFIWKFHAEFLNGIIHLTFFELSLSLLGISRWKLGSWSANSIEPGQTAWISYAGWPGSILVAKANHIWFRLHKG